MARKRPPRGEATRAAILLAVETTPGIGTSELARRVGVTPGAIRYHAAKLEGAGLRVFQGREDRYALRGLRLNEVEAHLRNALAVSSQRTLLRLISAKGLTTQELRHAAALPRSTFHDAVRKLIAQGLLRRDGERLELCSDEVARLLRAG